MDNQTNDQPKTTTTWNAAQTYTLAAICMLIGFAIGYFLRGSAPPRQTAVAVSGEAQSTPPGPNQQAMPTLADMKRMADKQVEPLLAQLKDDPKNVALLNKTALTYKAAHQFNEAISYFQKALEVDPKNVPIRTDMASCMYYTGNIDGALEQLNKSLSYDPKHAGTLMNIGIIKWQGKNDAKGAIAAWQTLLKSNPDFPQKSAIERLIEKAQESEGRSPSPLQAKEQSQ